MKKLVKTVITIMMSLVVMASSVNHVEAYSNNSVEAFVERMYKLAFNRSVDNTGKGWIAQLKNKSLTGGEFAVNILCSPEMYNRNLSEEEFIEICYKALMDRKSDAGGKAYHIRNAQNHKRSYIVKDFVSTKEFTTICNKYGITKGTVNADTNTYGVVVNLYDKTLGNKFNCEDGIVEFFKRNYQEVFNRQAETNGLNYWVNRVKTGQEHIGSAYSSGFFHSNEFLGFRVVKDNVLYDGVKNKYTSNEEFITKLYKALFNRTPKERGYYEWVEKLKSGQCTRDQIISGFTASEEFSNLIRDYQNRKCSAGCSYKNVLVKEAYDEKIYHEGYYKEEYVGTNAYPSNPKYTTTSDDILAMNDNSTWFYGIYTTTDKTELERWKDMQGENNYEYLGTTQEVIDYEYGLPVFAEAYMLKVWYVERDAKTKKILRTNRGRAIPLSPSSKSGYKGKTNVEGVIFNAYYSATVGHTVAFGYAPFYEKIWVEPYYTTVHHPAEYKTKYVCE